MTAREVTDATFQRRCSTRRSRSWWTSGPSGAARAAPCRRSSTRSPHEHSEKLEIVKLNVDDNPETAMKYGITSIPAMNVFRDGEIVKTRHRREAEARARGRPGGVPGVGPIS